MEYNKAIADMLPGDRVEGFYILKDAQCKQSNSGKPFLAASVADRTGSMDLKVWDYAGPVGTNPADIGRVVKIRGDVSEYRGSIQMVASNIRIAESTDVYHADLLVPAAPIDVDEALNKIYDLIDGMEDADYRAIARESLRRHLDSFTKIPAAKSVHHSFLHGLLMHTGNMLKTADFLAKLYGEIIDRSLLLTGTLLHDFAKEIEFTFSELGIVTDYSVKGQLLGHLVMGAQETAEIARELGVPEEKSVLLQHLILSHHGEPDFGAAVRPQCAEAELLSYIDIIDSRMEIYTENLPSAAPGTFTGRIYALEKKIYHHK